MFQWYLETVSSGVKINYTCTVYQQFIPKLQPLIRLKKNSELICKLCIFK